MAPSGHHGAAQAPHLLGGLNLILRLKNALKKLKFVLGALVKLVLVAQVCNPSSLGDCGSGNKKMINKKKVGKTSSQQQNSGHGGACLSPQRPWEAKSRIVIKASLSKIETPIRKTTRAERAGGVAQAAACLPSKCKALSSNPGASQKNKSINKRPHGIAWQETLAHVSHGLLPESPPLLPPPA
jgi:hypothetical protein